MVHLLDTVDGEGLMIHIAKPCLVLHSTFIFPGHADSSPTSEHLVKVYLCFNTMFKCSKICIAIAYNVYTF